MQQLSVFVSSTCYDLRALREHLRTEISAWGHDPILSEFPSFPVSPDLSTVENCKRVVRDRADVLVLIVGGKRGSLDPKSRQSVVNSEYREAKTAGIDCIVFVDKQVWDLRQHYQRNPEADFSPIIDNPDVFRFIDEIVTDTRWIFPFTRTDEILFALKTQLSVRFRDLLCRFRENRLTIPAEFSSEPGMIARIAQDKEPYWEFRLASELLKERVNWINLKFQDLNSGFSVRRTKFLASRNTFNYIHDLIDDLSAVVLSSSKILINQLTPAFGPPGHPGDALQIKRACDNLYSLFLTLYEWELDVRFVRPHEIFEKTFERMHGWADELLTEFRRIPIELDKLLSTPDLKGEHLIQLVINAPAGLSEFIEELNRMSQDPQILSAML